MKIYVTPPIESQNPKEKNNLGAKLRIIIAVKNSVWTETILNPLSYSIYPITNITKALKSDAGESKKRR